MYNSMCWIALTLSLCSRVRTEEVFESYTTLASTMAFFYDLDITSNGDTLVASGSDRITYIYSISGTTITSQQTITHTETANRGGTISADGQTLLTAHTNAARVYKKNVGTGDYDNPQTLTGDS